MQAMDGRESKTGRCRGNARRHPASAPSSHPRLFSSTASPVSGKTEIYLQAIAHALEQGKGAIVLVPEISLTPQTVERFKARFSSGQIADARRRVAFASVRRRTARRMAQDPPGPRAHRHRRALGDFCAGRTARPHHRGRGARAHLQAGGSAALPRARRGHHARPDGKRRRRARLGHAVAGKLLQLPARANTRCSNCRSAWTTRKCRSSASWTCGRPRAKAKGTPIFSPQLKEAITQRLERGEQTILFLNRRGYSTSLQCPKCGYVAECPNCSVVAHVSSARAKALPATSAATSKKFRPSARTRNAKIPAIRFAGTGHAEGRGNAGETLSATRASSAWTPTR